MPTKITPAALRSAADKQRVETPYRFGNTVCARTEHWDAVIIRRQLKAKEWREDLAERMDSAGVTELRASTIRIVERPSFRCRPITVTVYTYADGSVFLYRIRTRFHSREGFRRLFGEYYTLSPSGQFGTTVDPTCSA